MEMLNSANPCPQNLNKHQSSGKLRIVKMMGAGTRQYSRVARLVFLRPKFEDLVFFTTLMVLVWDFFITLFSNFVSWVFFVKIWCFWLFFWTKNRDVVFKNENFGNWFPGVRKNLTTLLYRGCCVPRLVRVANRPSPG